MGNTLGLPCTNSKQVIKQVALNPSSDSATTDATRNKTSTLASQVAANLGQQLHAESTASASPAADRQPKKVRINLEKNVCFEIPRESRTDKLVAELANKLPTIDSAIIQNQENNLAIHDNRSRQQMDGLQNQMGHLLKLHIENLVMQLEEIGTYRLVRGHGSLLRSVNQINNAVEQFVTAAMANNQPADPTRPANRPPTER